MTKIMQRVTAILFCLFIGGFGVMHLILPDREFSPMENRNLSQLPEFSWQSLKEGTYTADLEEYLADQFPLRDSWIGLKTRYEYLLGHREFKDVFLCGDTLISKITDTSRAQQNLGYVESLLGKTDLPVYLGLIPTAAEIWQEKLPEGAERFDQLAYLEQAKELGAITVDMYAALNAHKDEDIYYRTDHHWTSLGAYYGYTAFMQAAGHEIPELGEGKTVTTEFNGTLYNNSGIHWLKPDSIEYYVFDDAITVDKMTFTAAGTTEVLETTGLYIESKLETADKYASFIGGGNHGLYIVRNPNAPVQKKLLIIRDSYSDSLAPFLSQTYSEIHLLDLRGLGTFSVRAYIEMAEIDEIFVCYSVDNFLKDRYAVSIGR